MAERYEEGSKSALNYILAALLFIGGLLLLVVVINLRSQADDSQTSTTIGNEAPTVNTVTFAESTQGVSLSSFTVAENTTKNIYIYGSFTDNNGCADVTSLTMEFFQTGSAVSGCTYNDNRCYNSNSTGYSCNFTTIPGACSGGSSETGNYECTVPVQYFAEATDAGPYSASVWRGRIVATDAALATGAATNDVEILTLSALDVGSSISYGSLGLNAQSSDVSLTVTNTGNNDSLNVWVSGTAMACTFGSIPVGNQRYALASGVSYSSMIPLTGTATSSGAIVSKATSAGSPSNYNLYWKLLTPTGGVNGTCTGTTTFSGV